LPPSRPRIIWADDNADLRDYVGRLLAPLYDVEAVADGEAALAAVRRQPADLVLADAMMPRLDGFGLLRELRADPRTSSLPIILLSARAGEESRVEGLEAGADDYLVKPFSARELLARVSAHLQIARIRREAAQSMQESQERQAFLLQLSDALRPLADPVEIQGEAARLLGEYLGVNRVSYADIVGEDCIIRRGYVNGVAPLEGLFPVKSFGQALMATYQHGEAVAVADVAADPMLTAAERAAFQAAEIAAYLVVMLVKAGRWVAAFGADCTAPRAWTPAEVELVREVGERTWAAVERARVESALRDSEERFRTLADNMPQFAWMADAKGWIFWYNRRWYDYTGTTLEQMRGWGWKKVHHPDHVDRVVKRIQHSWDTGAIWEDTFPLRGKDGEYRWFLSRAIPIRDAEGRVLRWFGTNTDVTEQRAAEEALKEADRRKDEFLATLAHELRNPLAPIRNSLHILRLAGTDNIAAQRVHEMMERQVNLMVRLVDDLMEVSRISRGKFELRKEQVELAAVVRSAVETSKPLIEAARHQLAISLPAEPLILEADPVRLAQVLANLLNNAAKYTDEDGQIWLTARRDGTSVVVSVRDNGMGIPAEMLQKVFDLFTQVDRDYSRSQGGLGIGLTLVRSLVGQHGGSIEVKSDGPGQGSEFVVRLPLAAERPGPDDGGRGSDPLSAVAARRILVVDDNRDAADSLGMLLRFLGADVLTVHDGPAALEALRTYQPSVVLLDIGMPGMDGYEVARWARQQPEGRDAILIALTGWGQEEDQRRSHEAGIDHHLVKPVDLVALQALLASLAPRQSRPVPAK
jgi:PAS domain S-box-containing protein